MPKKLSLSPGDIIKALRDTNGMVYLAAERLGVSYMTVYRRAKRIPAIQEEIDRAKGKRLDVAETKLWDAVLQGQAWAICFYLKTQGKARGYIEKTITQVDGDAKLRIVETVVESASSEPADKTPQGPA